MEIDMTALRMVENEKGVSLETLVDAIEEALLKAYHNLPGAISQARIEIDKKTGRVTVMAMDEDEDGNPIGEFDDTPKNFGRIAQSTARHLSRAPRDEWPTHPQRSGPRRKDYHRHRPSPAPRPPHDGSGFRRLRGRLARRREGSR